MTRAIILAVALTGCVEVTEQTGLTPEQQLCLALAAAEGRDETVSVMQQIAAAGIRCLFLPPDGGAPVVVDIADAPIPKP